MEKYYHYVEKQKENYVDLTKDGGINEFAMILFSKSPAKLDQDQCRIFSDDMNVADLFCMLIELVLYGVDILTNKSADIFSLKTSTDDIIYTIKAYLKSSGFDMMVSEEFSEEVNLYRDRTDYFCQITKRPPVFLCHSNWSLLNYQIIENRRFSLSSQLTDYSVFFISSEKKIFLIKFKVL